MLYEKRDIIFENIKKEKAFEDEKGNPIPHSEVSVDVTEDDRERIVEEILAEKEAIEQEREDNGFNERVKSLRMQYNGTLLEETYEDAMFDLQSGVTKEKCRGLANRIHRTITSTDPLFSVSPRPVKGEMEQGSDSAKAQEDYIDYAVDERIDFKRTLKRVILDACKVPVSFIKWKFNVKIEKIRGKEKIVSDPKWIIVPQVQGAAPMIFTELEEFENQVRLFDANEIMYDVQYQNPGLKQFLKKYSESAEDGAGNKYADNLYRGIDIEIEYEYDEITSNDPCSSMVKCENLLFRSYCDSYKDLAETKLIVEKKVYTYHELKKLENDNQFFDIKKIFEREEGEEEADDGKDMKAETYEILECTYFTKLEDEDADSDEESKYIFWIYEEKELMVGAKCYDIEDVPCQYVPVKVQDDEEGLIEGSGIAGDITTEDISISLILRFMLEAWYYKNTVTPITENQNILDDFLERRWTHGMTLDAKPGEVRFLGEFIPAPDLRGGLELIAQTKKIAEDKIGLSSGMSGGADPVDPNAPATKTLALLNESKPDLLNYIYNIAPAINQCGYIIIAMYAQLTDGCIPYKARPNRVSKGAEAAFAEITKADLQAKTNIQTQAYAFAQDELMLKRELLAYYQMIRQEPMFASDPNQVNSLLRAITKAWNPQIRNKVNELIPTIEVINQKQAIVAMQGVAQYVGMVLQNAKMTGQEPEFDPRVLLQVVQEHIKDIVTPPQKEELKQREGRNEAIITGQSQGQ